MTDDGDDGRRRRPTTTVDGDKISSTHFAKNLGFQKNCEFLKNSENLIFFKGPSLGRKREMTTATTDDGDDRRRRRPTMTVDGEKISSTHFAKNLGFQKNCEFLKNSENLIFFKGPSLGRKREMTDDGDDRRRRRRRRRRLTMTVDGEKISSTHFAKNLGFQKNCEFLKNSENLIFFKGPSLGRKREMTDDGERPTTATTDDGDDRR